MTIAFVLGNGISRREIAPTQLQLLGKIYGCNGLYREFTPDVLVATDRPIATAIQESGYAKTNRFHTRRPLPDLGAQAVPHDYFGYSSGPIAVSLAASDQHKRIYLLGFDLGPTTTQGFNNIYAGTQFYKATNAAPTYTGNWIKQMCRIMRDNAHTKFYRVCGETSAHIAELSALPNLFTMDLSTFRDRINNQKDL
jgi:hypothetical protein